MGCLSIFIVHTDNFPTSVIKPIFMGTFAIASEQVQIVFSEYFMYLLFVSLPLFFQASKLGVGKNTSIISYYSGYQVYKQLLLDDCVIFNSVVFLSKVIQFNYLPFVLTFIADSNSNTGNDDVIFIIINATFYFKFFSMHATLLQACCIHQRRI